MGAAIHRHGGFDGIIGEAIKMNIQQPDHIAFAHAVKLFQRCLTFQIIQ